MNLVTPSAPKLILPMHFRRNNPFGYVHKQINWQGLKHPGYDLNDGVGAWADLGQSMFAPGHSLIKFAGKASGWGTLIVGYLAYKQPHPVTGELTWLGWRLGHPRDLYVKAGQRVTPGQVVGTCGNGGDSSMTPHAHFDMFDRGVMDRLGSEFVARYGQKEADRVAMPYAYWDRLSPKRDHFNELYVDPQHYFPELDSLFKG